jgi:hypothetical protein
MTAVSLKKAMSITSYFKKYYNENFVLLPVDAKTSDNS